MPPRRPAGAPRGAAGGGKKSKLRSTHELLRLLKGLTSKQRVGVLRCMDDSSCECVFEAVANVLRNDKIDQATRNRLKKCLGPHKKILRYLSNPKGSIKNKKKKLQEIGGFPLGMILKTALPFLSSILLS